MWSAGNTLGIICKVESNLLSDEYGTSTASAEANGLGYRYGTTAAQGPGGICRSCQDAEAKARWGIRGPEAGVRQGNR